MNIRVKQKKPFALNEFKKFCRENKKVVAVGFPVELVGDVRYPGKASKSGSSIEQMRVTDVAYINNFGSKTRNIEARPFMNKSVKPTEKMVISQNEKLAMMINRRGRSKEVINKYLNVIGEKAVSIHKKVITDLREPPNKPSTIANKKSSNPLIDTSLMRNTLTYIVRKKGK